MFTYKPSETVGDFKQKLVGIGREDVNLYMNDNLKLKDDELLSQLNFDILSKLSGRLEFSQKAVKNWKDLARRYEFSNTDIAGIDSTKVENQQYSPTAALIQALYMRKPEYKVSEFVKVLKNLNFNKVVGIIKKKYLQSSD